MGWLVRFFIWQLKPDLGALERSGTAPGNPIAILFSSFVRPSDRTSALMS
jgi:hypothetical protein